MGKRGDPVAIGRLERFLGDWEQETGLRSRRPGKPTGQRVALVGAGPAGMAASGLLAESGHEVHLFDALPTIGGTLAWGIPTFRLPDDTLEVEQRRLLDLGVRFHGSVRLGEALGLDELFSDGFRAVLLAPGAPRATVLDIPGAQLQGVQSATEFLSATKLDRHPARASRVVVIGGGNTAMDAAGTARRLGAEVTIVYRRSRAELPAREEEIAVAQEEGVSFQFLAAPVRFLGDERGRLVGVRCCRMTLGPRGTDGRAAPVPVPGEEFDLQADLLVLATGFAADPGLGLERQGVAVDARGFILADTETGRTSRPGVWASGDAVSGPATVVAAMAWGRRAARNIDCFLSQEAVGQDGAGAPLEQTPNPRSTRTLW